MKNLYALLQFVGLVMIFIAPFPMGMILGIILILWCGVLYRKETKKEKSLINCPHCAEKIQNKANVCKHCGKNVGDIE